MFDLNSKELQELGAEITVNEVRQQPDLWEEVLADFQANGQAYRDFVAKIQKAHDKLRVVFTGAGTSAFVGETAAPHLNQVNDPQKISFEAVATTDIVAAPHHYLMADIPTILVSFARSGNSPESVKAVQHAQEIVKDLYQVTITCAPEGKLAQQAQGDDRNLLILQPARSNDQGFAMTGSYTCMLLSALLLFDPSVLEKEAQRIQQLSQMGRQVIERYQEVQAVVDLDLERVIYLGTASFFGLAHEAQLKILELTAGQIATMYETPLGFRHGPKSFINEKTAVIVFNSTDDYTNLYDVDLINEVYHDQIAAKTLSIRVGQEVSDADSFNFDEAFKDIPDAYLALPFVVWAQTFAVMTAIKVANKPDTPSATGTVNRVVKGVIIH